MPKCLNVDYIGTLLPTSSVKLHLVDFEMESLGYLPGKLVWPSTSSLRPIISLNLSYCVPRIIALIPALSYLLIILFQSLI